MRNILTYKLFESEKLYKRRADMISDLRFTEFTDKDISDIKKIFSKFETFYNFDISFEVVAKEWSICQVIIPVGEIISRMTKKNYASRLFSTRIILDIKKNTDDYFFVSFFHEDQDTRGFVHRTSYFFDCDAIEGLQQFVNDEIINKYIKNYG